MRKTLIKALRRVLAADVKEYTLLAWGFDERLWKQAYHIGKQTIDKASIKEIKSRDDFGIPAVAWPHISAALVAGVIPRPVLHKMELAAEALAPTMEIDGVEILPGRDGSFLTLKFKSNYQFDAFFEFAVETFGRDKVGDYRSLYNPRHKPHASLLAVAHEDAARLESLVPEIIKGLSSKGLMHRPVKAEKLLAMEKFDVSKVHQF